MALIGRDYLLQHDLLLAEHTFFIQISSYLGSVLEYSGAVGMWKGVLGRSGGSSFMCKDVSWLEVNVAYRSGHKVGLRWVSRS